LQIDLGAPQAQKEAMRNLPLESKWTLITQAMAKSQQAAKDAKSIIAKLQTKFSLKELEHLVISLTREPLAWANDFIKHDGIKLLVQLVETAVGKEKFVWPLSLSILARTS
jgi:hypothetical protein